MDNRFVASPMEMPIAPRSEMDSNNNSNVSTPGDSKKVKRKRNRVPLSCTICRRRKVKCDKSRPNCDQCVKTGVAHLCHYMEQAWAEEAEKEISRDMELKQLRSKVKQLEETLSRYDSMTAVSVNNQVGESSGMNSGNSPFQRSRASSTYPTTAPSTNNNSSRNTITENSPALSGIQVKNEPTVMDVKLENESMEDAYFRSIFKKYDGDELDLTREFDMLHLKKDSGLIHLGPTHWLAIMKGDPYLKLLWKHIFTMREKLLEWSKQKKAGQLSKCPVDHSKMKLDKSTVHMHQQMLQNGNTGITNMLNQPPTGKCPVDHKALLGQSSGISSTDHKMPINQTTGKCPVDHGQMQIPNGYQQNIMNHNVLMNQNIPMSQPVNNSMTKCPVNHGSGIQNAMNSTTGMPQGILNNKNDISKCPVNHSAAIPTIDNINKDERGTNNMDTSQCPVNHGGKSARSRSVSPTLEPELKHYTKKEVTEMLRGALPPRGVTVIFINKFFEVLYQLIPIVDEVSFKTQLNTIFPQLKLYEGFKSKDKSSRCPFDHSKLSVINIHKASDYCTVGILIIMMRLIWLQLPPNTAIFSTSSDVKVKLTNDERYLVDFEIPTDIIDLVKTHLIEFDEISSISNTNVTLNTIQFAIFYRMILLSNTSSANMSTTNISMNNDNETHQGLLSSIVQMSFSCGLHRDPDNFPQLATVFPTQMNESMSTTPETKPTKLNSKKSKNDAKNNQKKGKEAVIERYKHTWRKLWYYIISLDIQQSFSLGTPRLLRNLKDFSDTKLPAASKIDYKNDIKELVIVKNFTLVFKVDLCIMAVLNHILNLSIARSLKKKDLDSLINSLSTLVNGERNINEVLNDLIDQHLLSASEIVSMNMQENLLFDHLQKNKNDDGKDTVLYGLPTMQELYITNNITPKDPTLMGTNNNSLNNNNSTRKFENNDSSRNPLLYSKHLTLMTLLYIMNYILFTRYEPLGESDPDTIMITKFYAQETLDHSIRCFKHSMLFFENVNKPMFKTASVLLLPQCLDVCHRSLQFFICLILRIKCGNVTGSGGGQCPFFTVKNDSENESENENGNKDIGSSNLNPNSENNSMDLDLDNPDFLQKTLISYISNFYVLTQKLSKSYPIAVRIMKSTGFFMTLLSDPGSKSNMNSFLPPKHPKIPSIASLLRNDGTAFLNADVSQLKRCPVYQDTIGFDTAKNTNQLLSNKSSISRFGTQLPPLRSYKPITYTSSDVRGGSSRGTSRGNSAVSSPQYPQSTQSEGPPVKRLKMQANTPQFQQYPDSNFSMGNTNVLFNFNNSNTDQFGRLPGVNMTGSPVPMPSNNPIGTPSTVGVGTPNEIENLLMANTNFAGINPSSMAEAIGINKSDPNFGLANMDFLPIDNMAFDYDAELGNIFSLENGVVNFESNEEMYKQSFQ
ncbi:Fungal specific transcription factor domain [Nakaseomyces bracarensis]|uniref:Fungal specific transcription factor domain n=1 Tax=Nakaseomyces bracarensis TaxID=273131 RepID=A0ABR4NMU1_9SACH